MALARNFVFQVGAGTKESAYDTAASIDKRININVGNIPQESVQVIADSDKVGGNEEPTDAVVFAKSV